MSITRDRDYGITYGDHSYINDHLRQEFSDRVSRRRDLRLFASLSDALKLFSVDVSKQERAAEKEVVAHRATPFSTPAQVLYNALLAPAKAFVPPPTSEARFFGEDETTALTDDDTETGGT